MLTLSALAEEQPRAVAAFEAAFVARRMHHAYALVSSDDARATAFAEALAARMLCTSPEGVDPCGDCPSCRERLRRCHQDLVRVVPNEKGVIGIEQIRLCLQRVALKPAQAEVKVLLLFALERATVPAQNALLKALEEPPSATHFVLTTARLRALLPTVRSRAAIVRLEARAPADVYHKLEASGVCAELARMLAPLFGARVDHALDLEQGGVMELYEKLEAALAPDVDWNTVLATTAELAREHVSVMLALLELKVRDTLAARHGAEAPMLHGAPLGEGFSPRALVAAARRLSALRKLAALHVNQAMGLEAVVRDLRMSAGGPL